MLHEYLFQSVFYNHHLPVYKAVSKPLAHRLYRLHNGLYRLLMEFIQSMVSLTIWHDKRVCTPI